MQSGVALAHDPIFGIGPHVLFKDGIEISLGAGKNRSGAETESEYNLELVYGITGDWAAGFKAPYTIKDDAGESASGLAEINLFTKYRFWRQDSLGLQRSTAIMIVINTNNSDETAQPALGNGAVDVMAGITYGYEGLDGYNRRVNQS